MNPVPASISRISSHPTWWNWIANPAKSGGDDNRPAHIDTEDFSDHMLRDIGMLDGRVVRGERTEADDLSTLLRDNYKRFL